MNLARIFMESAAAADNVVVSGSDAGMLGCAGGSIWTMLLMYAAIFGIMYLLMIRPQKKRRQQEEALRANIEVGDEIVTIGGICGRIVSIKEDDIIVIETGADRTKLKMKSWSISSNETARERQAEIEASQPKPEKKFSLFGKKDENK